MEILICITHLPAFCIRQRAQLSRFPGGPCSPGHRVNLSLGSCDCASAGCQPSLCSHCLSLTATPASTHLTVHCDSVKWHYSGRPSGAGSCTGSTESPDEAFLTCSRNAHRGKCFPPTGKQLWTHEMTDVPTSVGVGLETAHTPLKGQLRSAPAGWCCKVKMQEQ